MPSQYDTQQTAKQILDSVGYRIKTKIDELSVKASENTANIIYIAGEVPKFSANVTYIAGQVPVFSANVSYLSEVVAINDMSSTSTSDKSIKFHKFLTTEHIPTSNIFATLPNLEKSNDTYVTGLGAVGVKKNGADVFEEYFNGNYPGSMFSTTSCGKQLMGLTFGRMMTKGVGLHNVAGDAYVSNLLTLDTPVANIIYGTDLKAYGLGTYSLPAGLENARMRDLLSMRAGFHEYDGLLWFIFLEYYSSLLPAYSLYTWPTTAAVYPLSAAYADFAGNAGFGPYAVTIETFADVQNKTNQYVNLRNFGLLGIKDSYVNLATVPDSVLSGNGLLDLSFFAEATTSNVFGDLFTSPQYSNTSVRYQRSAYPLYGQDKLEHYNNECFLFATKMMQIALMKEAVNGDRTVLTDSTLYSNVGIYLSGLSANTFGATPNPVYISKMRDNFRNFFNYEVLTKSGVPNVNTKLTVLQSDNYGTIIPDLSHVAFPHLMGIADTFAKDLFLVRDDPSTTETSVYSNLFLSNITLYNFSSNVVPRLQPFNVDPFDTPDTIRSGELLNNQKGFSMTNGIWTVTDILANNRQVSSNVYQMYGLYGQRMIMGRSADKTNRYTVGMMSDDVLNNPLVLQGPEFVYDNRNTVRNTYTTSELVGSTDPTVSLITAAYNDSVAVPYAASGSAALSGFRTRQDVDKAIAYIKDLTPSSNIWGYDSVGLVLTGHQNADRAYYSNLTSTNKLKVADPYTGELKNYSNCIADVHYSQYDIFDRAKLTF